VSRQKTNSVREKRCEFCSATTDLEEARVGPGGKGNRIILVCVDQRACQSRWPEKWPSGTLGVPSGEVGGNGE